MLGREEGEEEITMLQDIVGQMLQGIVGHLERRDMECLIFFCLGLFLHLRVGFLLFFNGFVEV